jgi:hypothetical protein
MGRFRLTIPDQAQRRKREPFSIGEQDVSPERGGMEVVAERLAVHFASVFDESVV